jgi:hypothetical protein
VINILGSRNERSQSRRSGTTRAGRALVFVGIASLATGLAVGSSVAAGESTTAELTSPLSGTSTTFTWSYQFHADGDGHGLSNIAISLCSTDLLAHVVSATPSGEKFVSGDVPGGHTGFGPGIKFATTAVSGTLTVVFDQPYAAGGIMKIQSHSGDGQTGDLVTTAAGPGDCAAQASTTTTLAVTTTTAPVVTTTTALATTTTTLPPTTTTLPPTTTTVPPTTTTVPATTTTLPATTTTLPATTTTVPATTTTVPPTTTTAPATTTTLRATTTTVAALAATTTTPPTTAAPTTSTSVPTSVLGNRFVDDGTAADLAGTGFNGGPLVAFGALCLALGAVLLVGSKLDPARN